MSFNLNLSASLNASRLLFKPSLCLPHHTVPTFSDLPIPLDTGLHKKGLRASIKAVVLDKDDCFAVPDTNQVYEPYSVSKGGSMISVICSVANSSAEAVSEA